MTKLKLTLHAVIATSSLANPASSFAADARMTQVCTRKLRFVLRVLLLVWAAGSAGILDSAQGLAQNAYITNESDNTVSVIDTVTNVVTATIPFPAGSSPYGVAVTPDGRKVYVTTPGSQSVSVIKAANNKVMATISVGAEPLGLAITPDGTRVYVGNNASSNISVIDTKKDTVITTITVGAPPFGVAISPDGSRAYVSNSGSFPPTVSVINTTNNNVIATITVTGVNPDGLAVTPDGSRVYVANIQSNNVSVIDTASNTVQTIPVGSFPFGVAISPDGSTVYVTNENLTNSPGANTVSVIDTKSNMVIDTILVGANPVGVSVSPDGSKVYVANSNSNNVSVLDTKNNNKVTTTIAVGAFPVAFGIFIQPEGARKFAGTPGAANCASNSLSALSNQYAGLGAAAAALSYSSVLDLEDAVLAYCGG